MPDNRSDRVETTEMTCGFLLLELQKIWDEVGEDDVQKDEILLEIEQECLEVYERKVNKENERRSELRREITSIESEIEGICGALGEPSFKEEKKNAMVSLKEKIESIKPWLEEMRKRQAERKTQFIEILNELKSISKEIVGPTEESLNEMDLDDLSLKRLEELQNQLREFKAEKSKRLKQVLGLVDIMHSQCLVLDMDFKNLIQKIHPTYDETGGPTQLSDDTIMRLTVAIESLRDVKKQRMLRLRDLGSSLLDLGNLMEIPIEEQQILWNVTSYISASEPEITEPKMLSMDLIKQVEAEVLRLEELKSGKLKEIVTKKRLELEEICRSAHIVPVSCGVIEDVMSGDMNPMNFLEEIDLAIARAKDEACSRKEILDKVGKWLAACEEESWLEEYNRDGNRYNAGRGAHLALKRAEKARSIVKKIPAMVEMLKSKIMAWETERGTEFLYYSERLLSRLELYNNLRKEKEEEKLRQRGQKKLQVQLIAEQEARFGAKPSPSRSGKKGCRASVGAANDRKLSLGGAMLQNLKADRRMSVRPNPMKKGECIEQNNSLDFQQHVGISSQICGNRNSTRARQSESRLIRKPLSSIPLSMCSESNIEKFTHDQMIKQEETPQPQKGTPTRPISSKEGDNRTPKTHIIEVPKTPTTALPPMLIALTPATPYHSSSTKAVSGLLKNIEYSFEEVRAGFICPNPQLG